MFRKPAVAGRWYPGTRGELTRAVDGYLAAARRERGCGFEPIAIVAPHAGLIYSGPVAAYAYREIESGGRDLAILVGPSHFEWFEGVAIDVSEGFETPLGPVAIDRECADRLMALTPIVHEHPTAHAREHSLEMQLPFLQRIAPSARIVALLVGHQTAATAAALGDALAAVARNRRAVLIASTDLSHYRDRATAARMDAAVIDRVAATDPDGLQTLLDREPHHACGGGPTVAVMRAARLLGATRGAVLKYADSGDVSGDTSAVVGYLAGAFGHAERQ
jgi:AmmeMemoRadiSam system protein B